jgi:putative transposase
MARPYSMDLPERAVRAVELEGLSRRAAAIRFGMAASTLITWVARFRATGDLRPGQMGGHKPKTISGDHRAWLLARCRAAGFTLRGLVTELAERGLVVDDRSVWEFVHAEKLSYKKRRWPPASRTVPTLPDAARNG